MSATAAEQPGGCGKMPTQLTAHHSAISTRWDMKREPGNHTQPREMHRSGRAGWLRAAVLGSDDAIVSTASLMIGVAAASASKGAILVAGVAGLVAGAMSMAVGEYVSVSSQRDAEQADVGREKGELAAEPEAELQELAMIYMRRGIEKDLAMKVAEQLSAHDRLGAKGRRTVDDV